MTPRHRIGLAAALAGAFLLRVLLVISLEGKPFFYTPIVDSATYDRWATEIATKSFWGDRPFFHDPLYAYGLGVFYAVFGRDLLWARLVQALLGTLGLWMLFEAARRFAGYRTAIVTLVLGALTQTLAFFDAALLKDFLGVVAMEAALLFWSLDRKWKWLGFGAALALGALVRGNFLLLILAAAAFQAVRKEWKPAGLTLAGAALVILPVTIRNAAAGGDFVVTTSHFGANLFIGNNSENTTGRYRPPSFVDLANLEGEERGFREEAERLNRRPMKPSEVDAYWRGRAAEYIWQNPGTFVVVTAKRLAMLLNSYEIPDDHNPYFMARFSWVLRLPLFTFGLFLLPLAAAGLYLSWIERERFAMLYVLAGAYALSVVFFFIFARYRLPLVPLLLFFAAHAAVKGAQLVQWQMRQVPKTAAAVFAAALVVANVPLPAAVGGHRDFRAAHYNLGLYYLERESWKEAAGEFEAAAKLNPEYLRIPVFVEKLAGAHERSGDLGRAFERYELLAALDPASPAGPYKVGTIYLAHELWEPAAAKFAEAARRDRRFGAAYVPLAEAHRRLKRYDIAIQALQLGSTEVPEDWGIRLKKAELYRETGMWKEALGAAEETLRLKPGQPDALRIRDEARRKAR